MITVIDGDLFESDAKFICHQVNCKGKMGFGVALQVRQKYPHVYAEYKKICSSDMLGTIQSVPMHKEYVGYDSGSLFVPCSEQWIVNMFAQNHYGYGHKMYTSLDAFERCLMQLHAKINSKNNDYNAKIAMPWKIGCCRGGADWAIVYDMIDQTFKNNHVELWRCNKF